MSLANSIKPKCPDCEAPVGGVHLVTCSVVRVTAAERQALLYQSPITSVLHTFDAEIATITQRRGDVYGHPTDDFNTAAALMAHFDHIEPPALRHALRMVCVKLARITTTPDHIDSYVDIVGYTRTAVMILDRAEREKDEALN